MYSLKSFLIMHRLAIEAINKKKPAAPQKMAPKRNAPAFETLLIGSHSFLIY